MLNGSLNMLLGWKRPVGALTHRCAASGAGCGSRGRSGLGRAVGSCCQLQESRQIQMGELLALEEAAVGCRYDVMLPCFRRPAGSVPGMVSVCLALHPDARGLSLRRALAPRVCPGCPWHHQAGRQLHHKVHMHQRGAPWPRAGRHHWCWWHVCMVACAYFGTQQLTRRLKLCMAPSIYVAVHTIAAAAAIPHALYTMCHHRRMLSVALAPQVPTEVAQESGTLPVPDAEKVRTGKRHTITWSCVYTW